MAANIGWLFYKDYYRGINYNDLEDPNNKQIIENKVQNIIGETIDKPDSSSTFGNIHFKATTLYPGLLIGSGNSHELPHIEGQAILGFQFDYTSGLPIIPGSSLKGALRSAFAYPDYIRELLGDEGIDAKALEEEIFDNGDIFFDASLLSGGKILGDDYITPHGDDPFQSPTPLRFIKVMPGVTFGFDFELSDGIVTREQKRELFKQILEDFGVGAKTNVGYGQFSNFTNVETEEEREKAIEDKFNSILKLGSEAVENLSEMIENAKKLLDSHQDHRLAETLREKKSKLEELLKKRHIEESWGHLDKSKVKHIKSFVAKYNAYPLASEYIIKAKALLSGSQDDSAETKFDDIEGITKIKALDSFIKKIIAKGELSEDEKLKLESHVLEKITDKPKKRNKFPFSTLGNIKALGKERANTLADRWGL